MKTWLPSLGVVTIGVVLVLVAETAPTTEIKLPPIYETTTYIPEGECGQYYKKCEKCVKNPQCLYCYSDRKCKPWPRNRLLPPPALCALGDARWSVCWLNFKALIIAGAVLASIIIIGVSCCVYCWCCRGSSKRARLRYQKEEEKWEQDREERRMKADERKAERQVRADEIRAKYGIRQDPSYQRFDS